MIVISGIGNPERAKLRDIVLSMGGGYRPDWEQAATHLIAVHSGTQKYAEAVG